MFVFFSDVFITSALSKNQLKWLWKEEKLQNYHEACQFLRITHKTLGRNMFYVTGKVCLHPYKIEYKGVNQGISMIGWARFKSFFLSVFNYASFIKLVFFKQQPFILLRRTKTCCSEIHKICSQNTSMVLKYVNGIFKHR